MPNLKLKYIIDEDGDRVAPITHIDAVRNSNGDSLTGLMAPEKLGFGIGTCSTSSGTALEVVLSDYELVQNGFVAVTFENDVPANATLNINSKGAKPIIYKGAAIESDTIKADDTVMFSYDGTNYVVTSLGGGGAVVNPNEIVYISLSQGGGSNSDLIGVAITITDDDSGDTILSTTWQGNLFMQEIAVNTNYTVTVGSVTGYVSNTTQSYTAAYQKERTISFTYFALGVYIESTDHNYYTSSQWASSGKTANAICLVTSTIQIGIAPVSVNKPYHSSSQDSSFGNYMTAVSKSGQLQYYDGEEDTIRIRQYNKAKGTNTTNYAAPYCMEYVFGDGSKGGYVMSSGEANIMIQNKTAINACASIIGFTIPGNFMTSTYSGLYSTSDPTVCFLYVDWTNSNITGTGGVNLGSSGSKIPVRKLI